jgi:hypothetical protein
VNVVISAWISIERSDVQDFHRHIGMELRVPVGPFFPKNVMVKSIICCGPFLSTRFEREGNGVRAL